MPQVSIDVDTLVWTILNKGVVLPFKKLSSTPTLIDTLGTTVTTTCRIKVDVVIAPRNVHLSVTVVSTSARRTEPEGR